MGGCAAAEGLVVVAVFPSDVIRQGDNDFLIASRCDSACQEGQEMCCLVSPDRTVALQHWHGVGLLGCPQVSTSVGLALLS